MSLEIKTARHECNVIKRLIAKHFPRVHIQYILHKENERKKAFGTQSREFTDHPAGKYILDYSDKEYLNSILKNNNSEFACIAQEHNPGFLGFFKKKSYFALCFINYDHFENIETLRNHAFNLSWHAIAFINDCEAFLSKNNQHNSPPEFKDEENIFIPDLQTEGYQHRNLQGDIFAACVQMLMKRTNAFETIIRQRITETLVAKKGFCAENYPFPLCVDTLEHVLRNNIRYQKSNRPVQTAIEITEDISATYPPTSAAKWQSFSVPAQQMAWSGHDPQTILGAALYTGENTYAQSIADMIAERMSVTPQIVTNLQDYNPFTNPEANERMHRKLCIDLMYNLLAHLTSPEKHMIVTDVIRKQNLALLEGKVMSWCVPALIPVKQLIRECPDKNMMPVITTQATKMFEKEIEEIPWETLAYFQNIIFIHRRNNGDINMQDLLQITQDDDELSSINYGLKLAEEITAELSDKAI